MSQARVYTSQKSRKVWVCGRCREELPVGSKVHGFAVGFRGTEQKRCDKPGCYPTRSELESSMVAEIYSEIDGADIQNAESRDDLESIRDAIADACNSVADEYESNPMHDVNPDLQERAETVRAAAEQIEGWEPDGDEPEEEDCEDCDGKGYQEDFPEEECVACDATGKILDQAMLADWLETAKASLQEAIDEMELP